MCSNMDGPKDYQTKWNKPGRKRQIAYDTAYMWNLRVHFKLLKKALVIPEELKAGSHKDICTNMFIAAFFTLAKR